MTGIAKFERVSFEQFRKDCKKLGNFPDGSVILSTYNNIRLPKRATACSAGYDFFVPLDIQLPQRHAATIPTGIKCRMDEGWVLQMYPRSGYGIKYGLRLANTVGIIDGDYYNNIGNEGHILIKLINDAPFTKDLKMSAGTAFCQGIFLPFGITTDDKASAKREGGFGSSGK